RDRRSNGRVQRRQISSGKDQTNYGIYDILDQRIYDGRRGDSYDETDGETYYAERLKEVDEFLDEAFLLLRRLLHLIHFSPADSRGICIPYRMMGHPPTRITR